MVQISDLGRVLDEQPFMQGLDRELRDLLVGCAANERFDAGQYVFREGGAADKFFLVRSGRIAIEVHAPGRPAIMVDTVGPGELTGWSWLMEPRRWTFDARATQLTRAVSFDAACLTRKMEARPALGYQVLKRFIPVMAHRIHSARMQMLDLYGPPGGGS